MSGLENVPGSAVNAPHESPDSGAVSRVTVAEERSRPAPEPSEPLPTEKETDALL